MQDFEKNSCRQCTEHLYDYTTELTDRETTEKIQRHLAVCPSCQKEYEQICAMLRVLRTAPEPELPEDFSQNLHQKLLEENREATHRKNPSRRKTWRILVPAVACAALVIGVFLSGAYRIWKQDEETVPVATSKAEPTIAEQVAETETEQAQPQPSEAPQPVPTNVKTPVQKPREALKKTENTPTQKSQEIPKKAENTPIQEPTAKEEANPEPEAPAKEEAALVQDMSASTVKSAPITEPSAEEETAEENSNVMMASGRAFLSENAMCDEAASEAVACEIHIADGNVERFLTKSGIGWRKKVTEQSENRITLELSEGEWQVLLRYARSCNAKVTEPHSTGERYIVTIQG